MKLSNFASTLFICALGVPLFAASSNPAVSREQVHYTKAELAHLTQEAHTTEQYSALAVYFEHRKASYQDQAAQMKREWDRRAKMSSARRRSIPGRSTLPRISMSTMPMRRTRRASLRQSTNICPDLGTLRRLATKIKTTESSIFDWGEVFFG
jgi:hypothetical protein